MMQQLGTFCWWLDLLLMIRVWKSFFLGSVITWSLMRSSQKSAAGMIPYPSRSWASNRKRCPPNLWILDVFLGLHPTDSPSTKKKACGLSHSFFWGISRMMRLPGNSKRLYLLCEISYGLPQRLTGTHVFFVFFNDRPPWKKMWLLSRALKEPREVQLVQLWPQGKWIYHHFWGHFLGLITSSSVFYIPCIHTVFLGGWCFMKGSSKIILVPRIDGSM